MFGYPPWTRDQRIGTALTVLGVVVVFTTDRHLVYGHWQTYLWPTVGLGICALGVYFNTRRQQH